jgi:hypothetical protein
MNELNVFLWCLILLLGFDEFGCNEHFIVVCLSVFIILSGVDCLRENLFKDGFE